MKSPPILELAGFGTLRAIGIDIFPVESVVGGSRVLDPGIGLGTGTSGGPPGEFALRIDFSWNVSRSELGERPPGEGRSYGERLVMLLPPTERADEYEPDVRMLSEEAAESVLWLGA